MQEAKRDGREQRGRVELYYESLRYGTIYFPLKSFCFRKIRFIFPHGCIFGIFLYNSKLSGMYESLRAPLFDLRGMNVHPLLVRMPFSVCVPVICKSILDIR